MAPSTYDFWLFDLDGTLVDVEPSYPRRVFEEVGNRLGHGFSEREAEILWYGMGGAREDVIGRLDVGPDQFWDVFHEVEGPERRARASFVYDDAATFVSELDGPVGVVTHCQSYLTQPLLDRLDIRDWFDTVVCCDDDVGWKPDPRPVELAMNDLGVSPDRSRGVLAGDDPADIGAAWNAGLDALYVGRVDPERRGQCVLGDHRVSSFADVSF